MNALTAKQLEALDATLVGAFDPTELARLTRNKLGTRLDVITPSGTTPSMVSAVLNFVERHGWTRELIRGMYEERPDHPDVLAFCRAHAPFVFTEAPSTATLARSIGQGLQRVADGVQTHRLKIRSVLSKEARSQLGALAAQFGRIHRYKFLHDCLHSIQFKYARLIKSELRHLTTDPTSGDNLRLYCQEMSRELLTCQPELAGLPTSEAEQIMLRSGLHVVKLLETSAQSADAVAAGNAFKMLESMLRVHPSRINQHLSDGLDALQLDHLYGTFIRLRDEVPAGPSWDEALSEVVVGLGGLGPRLKLVLDVHRNWQLVDNTLTKIDTDLRQSTPLFVCEFDWLQAERILLMLLDQAGANDPVAELRPLATALSDAFGTANTQSVVAAFSRLRPREMWFFYEADRDLKKLSGDLDDVGERLSLVLRGIDDASDE